MTDPNPDLDIIAATTELSGDAYQPGISQPVTLDEITDIIHATDPVEVRIQKLKTLRAEFESRNTAVHADSFQAYIDEIDRGLAELQGPADGSIVPGALDEFDNAAGFDEESAVD